MARPAWRQATVLAVLASCGRNGFDAPDAIVDAPDATAEDGLVAWYPMESDPATSLSLDATGHGNDASCSGSSCPVRAAGVRGYAILLDGIDDRFVVPDAPMLRLSGGFTVTLWMQWLGGDAAVVSKPQAMGTGASFEISVLPQELLACTDDTLGPDGELCLERPGPPPPATWTALALTWNGALRTLYVDGEPVASSQHGAAFDDSPVVIGGDNHDGTPSSSHHGLIDEVRIYDRALTASEIGALHAR